MNRTRTALLCAASLLAAVVPLTTGAATATARATATGAGSAFGGDRDDGCVSAPRHPVGQARDVVGVAQQAKKDLDLNAVLFKVTVDGRNLVTDALGESMTDVPADPAMHFRAGSVAFPYLGAVLLQLVEEGKVSLDDPLSRWLPEVPHSREITLRMLGSTTSGLHDYVTDPAFLTELEAHPFKHWTPKEVVAFSLSHPLWYKPGTNWSYSHANFQLLGAALERITGTPLAEVLRERAFDPLGMDETTSNDTPAIPSPVLHAFTSERGTYEESTFWNPSWTAYPGAIITSDICDLATSARAVGTGALLSPSSFRVQLNPGTVGLGGPTATCPATVCIAQTEAQHFGLGVIVSHGWIVQNPSFSGYAAFQAYLPAKHLAIAVSTTKGPNAPDGNTAEVVGERIAALLAPGYPIGL
jgi:CubicO group peptidase (beta-lactamase class C family)